LCGVAFLVGTPGASLPIITAQLCSNRKSAAKYSGCASFAVPLIFGVGNPSVYSFYRGVMFHPYFSRNGFFTGNPDATADAMGLVSALVVERELQDARERREDSTSCQL